MLGNVRRRWQHADAPWWRKHSLGIVLVALLLSQMVIYHFTVLPVWVSTQRAHGASTALWPDYWLHYWAKWHVNMLGGTYGALVLVVLTKYFYESGSKSAEDPPEERESKGQQ